MTWVFRFAGGLLSGLLFAVLVGGLVNASLAVGPLLWLATVAWAVSSGFLLRGSAWQTVARRLFLLVGCEAVAISLSDTLLRGGPPHGLLGLVTAELLTDPLCLAGLASLGLSRLLR